MKNPHTKTRKHSKINHLPDDVRAEVEQLLLQRTNTYEDISEFLKSKGFSVTDSSVCRYSQDFNQKVNEIREFESIAKTLISNSGDGLIMDEALSKMVSMLSMQKLMKGGVEALETPFLISNIAKLQASSVQREKFKADLKSKINKVFDKAETKEITDPIEMKRLVNEILETEYGIRR